MGTPIANPMSGHGGYKRNRTLWGIDAIGTVICQVGTLDEVSRVGFLDVPLAALLLKFLWLLSCRLCDVYILLASCLWKALGHKISLQNG